MSLPLVEKIDAVIIDMNCWNRRNAKIRQCIELVERFCAKECSKKECRDCQIRIVLELLRSLLG